MRHDNEWSTAIDDVESKGDTRDIHQNVKVLGGKPQKLAPQLVTNKNGETIVNVKYITVTSHHIYKPPNTTMYVHNVYIYIV